MISAPQASAVVRRDGYLPIEDHGLIGDGSTCALVGRDGGISWLCLPDFDSPPFFAGILDADHGGLFQIAPVRLLASSQRYMEDSCVLVTSLSSENGMLQVTDALSLRSGADLREPVPAGRCECLDGTAGLDAALLTLPIRNVIAFNDPRMVSTTAAISRTLDAGDGLLFRYLPEESPDGLPAGEGAFLLCSFWLVDNLAGQGRIDEAHELYESLCSRANPLGLLPEQIHPGTGEFLGNFPQAFSHVGVLASGLRLLKAERASATGSDA